MRAPFIDATGIPAEYTRLPAAGCNQADDQHERSTGQQPWPAEAKVLHVQPQAEEIEARLAALPKEVGVLLVTIGTMGIVLPGIVGTPALLAGGLMLWPRGFRTVNGWLQRRCPKIHSHGAAQLIRYLDDLERRYPTSTAEKSDD